MGLPISCLRFLAREHKRRPFEGPVLTLGRQNLYATYEQVRSMLEEEGIRPATLPQGVDLGTNLPDWEAGQTADYTNDKVFFLLLGGLEVSSLDISPAEGPDHVVDLNLPLPDELVERFGVIVDGGTLEHVFDVNAALRNINRMLKPGGRVIHMSPVSNWAEHGYYQFSPTLFYDYYGANRFEGLQGYLVEQSPLDPMGKRGRKFWGWDIRRTHKPLMSGQLLLVYFRGEKTESSTIEAIPQQGQFRASALSGATAPAVTRGTNPLRSLIRGLMPVTVRTIVNRLLRRETSVKPWGLKYLGKL
jgi:SAM-dependent methyltransferase